MSEIQNILKLFKPKYYNFLSGQKFYLLRLSCVLLVGENLKELRGKGLTGMMNMGNTCYLNSTLQVLLSIPEFQQL